MLLWRRVSIKGPRGKRRLRRRSPRRWRVVWGTAVGVRTVGWRGQLRLVPKGGTQPRFGCLLQVEEQELRVGLALEDQGFGVFDGGSVARAEMLAEDC